MKKTVKQQARRARALARFKYNPERAHDAEYMLRKLTEEAALKSRLGA